MLASRKTFASRRLFAAIDPVEVATYFAAPFAALSLSPEAAQVAPYAAFAYAAGVTPFAVRSAEVAHSPSVAQVAPQAAIQG